MSISLRGKTDAFVDQVVRALKSYVAGHPNARVEVYRQSSVSIRVRIIDPDFAGIGRAERHEIVWHLLETLPEDVQSQMSLLLTLTPEETKASYANEEFDNPVPSRL